MKAEKELSRRTRKLYENVRDGARFYRWTPEPSRYMRELIDAGLVTSTGRVITIERCFVPTGTRPFRVERFPR